MDKAYDVVRPGAPEWSALPLRPSPGRQRVIAWLICVAATVAAFIADRAWETLDDDAWAGPYRIIDMFGLSGILLAFLFSLGGWMFGRLAMAMAPLVLACAAVPHTLEEYASAPFWWAGTLAATFWFLSGASSSVRQLRAVRSLARQSSTGLTMTAGPAAREALKRIARGSTYWAWGLSVAGVLLWTATFTVLPTELGRTYAEIGETSFSDFLATAALFATILAFIQWTRRGWRGFARHFVGHLIWLVPRVPGPIQGLASAIEGAAGVLPFNEAHATPGCTCIEEHLRSQALDDEDDPKVVGVPASDYCQAHGIDQVNALTPEQFRSHAATTWLWDEDSPEPASLRPESDRALLIGLAGHAFTGLPARSANGRAEIEAGRGWLVDERTPGTEEWYPEHPRPPLGGELDRIDLAPAGLDGQAIRYRHGRAWFSKPVDPLQARP